MMFFETSNFGNDKLKELYMANKILKTRVQNKHDTSANWEKATTFVPLAGEVIVYDDLKRIKIGDGQTTVTNLAFFDNYLRNNVDNMKASNNGLWELDPDMNFTKLAAIPGVKVYSSIGGTNITSQLGTGKYIDSNCVNSIFKSTETVIIMPTSSSKTIIYKRIVVTEGTKYYVRNPMVSTSPLSAYDIIVVSGGYPSRYCSSPSKFTLFSQAVVANSGTGTTALTSLKIGDTIYSIPGGGGSGDVTTAGNNTFTGENTFTDLTNFEEAAWFKVNPVIDDLGAVGGQRPGIEFWGNENGSHILKLSAPTIDTGEHEIIIPCKNGTIATTEDIPIKSVTLNGTTLNITLS